jgi:hypothetical protein
MPRIDLITKVLHEGLEPYHLDYDNLPLKGIIERINLINHTLDTIEEILNSAQGSTINIGTRIDQSINDNGELKEEAINEILHNIGYHTDGEYDGIEYCRFTQDERNKLENISDEAKNISFEIPESDISNIIFDNGLLKIENTDNIKCEFESPNILKFNLNFNTNSLHNHYYNVIPNHVDELDPDYQNYILPIEYQEDTLRIYINGIKISENGNYVYDKDNGPSGDWYLTSYTLNEDMQSFTLSRSLNENDEILVDFDSNLD